MRVSALVTITVLLASAACNSSSTDQRVDASTELKPVEIDVSAETASAELLDAISDLVGSASIVAIGESRHDTREQFLIKATIVKILITEFDYRTLVLEESFPHALSLDEYVTTGRGDIRSSLTSLAGWYLWDTEEMVDLLRWIREYNASVADDEMVRVLGMDVTAPFKGIASVASFAEVLDPDGGWLSRDFGADLHEGDFWPTTLDRYRLLDDQRSSLIGKNLDDLAKLVSTAVSENEVGSASNVSLMQIQAEIGQLGHSMFEAESFAEIGARREHGMARAIEWIDNEIAGSGKMIIWTHNLHAAKTTFLMPQMGSETFTPMGVLLSRSYGSKYRAIGGTFGAGYYSPEFPPGERTFLATDRSTVDGMMSELTEHEFLLVFRRDTMLGETIQWYSEEREWRMQDSTAFLSPFEGFDAIYFVPYVSRAALTPGALERYSSQN